MKTDFIKVWRVLSDKERWKLMRVSALHCVSALTDVAGVLSIMPFLAVAVNPELSKSNSMLNALREWVSFSDEQFLVLLGAFSLGDTHL